MFSRAISIFPSPHSFISRRSICPSPHGFISRGPIMPNRIPPHNVRLIGKPVLFVHGVPKNMEAEEPDEFKRKGSEEAGDTINAGITKDDILEMEVAVEYACRWMGFTMKIIHKDKFPIQLEQGKEHQMFMDVLTTALFSSDPAGVFERSFPLVDKEVTAWLFLQVLLTSKERLEASREKSVEKEKVFEGSFPPMSLFFELLDIAKEKLGANRAKPVEKEKLAAAEEHEEEGENLN